MSTDESEDSSIIETFDDFKLHDDLLRGIYSYGFEKPSPIQKLGIPTLLKGRDALVQAPSGTGKTAMYAITILQRLREVGVVPVPLLKVYPATTKTTIITIALPSSGSGNNCPGSSSSSSGSSSSSSSSGSSSGGSGGSSSSSSSSSTSGDNSNDSSDNRIIHPPCSALVLVPTRELAMGVSKVIENLATYLAYSSTAVCGGLSIRVDITKLLAGVNVVVGTPGRVLDMVNRGALNLSELKVLVLDELDESLARGFRDQLFDIWDHISLFSLNVQVCTFSARVDAETGTFINNLAISPVILKITQPVVTLEGTKQFYVFVEDEKFKLETLKDLGEAMNGSQMLVFCNTRRKTEWLHERLGVSSYIFGAGIGPHHKQFILATTLDLNNGQDVRQSVRLIVNYDVPSHPEAYFQRVGQSGRFGRKGAAVSLATRDDMSLLKQVETAYCTSIVEFPLNFDDLF